MNLLSVEYALMAAALANGAGFALAVALIRRDRRTRGR